jgi:hypothetical protein
MIACCFGSLAEYTEGVDYFQADQMLEYAQIHVLSRESALEQEQQQDVAQGSAAEEEDAEQSNNDHDEEEEYRAEDVDSEDEAHEAEPARSSASGRNTSAPAAKKRARSDGNKSGEFAGADTMRFAELWDKLKRLGWTSVYGSGLVERYYLCPGVDKHTGTPRYDDLIASVPL